MKSKKLLLAPAIAAGLVLAYAGLGFYAVPAVVKSQAQQFAQQQFKRQLTMGQVAFNPFTLAASLRDVKLMEPDGRAVFVSFDALETKLSWQSLAHLAPVVEKVRLAQPYVHLARGMDGRYSIADIQEWLDRQPPSPEPALFSVNNIELTGGRLAFDDRPAHAEHTVEGLQLGLPFISSMPADVNVYVQPLLSATIDGAPLHIQGKARPYAEQREFMAELKLEKLDLPQLLGYLPSRPGFRLPSAQLAGNFKVQFVQPKKGGSSLLLEGDASLAKFDLRGADGAPVLKFSQLSARFDKLDPLAGKYAIAKISLDGLDGALLRSADGTLDLDRLMPASAPAASTAPANPAKAAEKSSTVVAIKEVAIRDAALRYADATPQGAMKAGLQRFALDVHDIAIDTGKRTVAVGEVVSDSAALTYAQGKRVEAPAQAPAAPVPGAGKPYQVQVGKMDVRGWSVNVEDGSRGQPLALALAPLQVSVRGWSNAPASSSDIDVAATVNRSGKLGVKGSLAAAPFKADLALDLRNLDLQPLQPLIADVVNLRVMQAALSANGKLVLEQDAAGAMKGGYKGNASVERLATVDRLSSADFLSWKSLAFGGMDVQLQPFAMNVDKVALADFFARVIIDPSGRINVQDVMRTAANEDRSLTDAQHRAQEAKGRFAGKDAGKDAALARAGAKPDANAGKAAGVAAEAKSGASAAAMADARAGEKAGVQSNGKAGTQTSAQTSAQAGDKSAAPMPPIRIGQLVLSGGRVRFTDNFIKPNYTANLKDLGGTVTGLSSDPAVNAVVDLKGNVNSAPLSIAGTVQPLKRDLYLDLKADVRGMELAALSAYADKYVGYGIEKGKLSFEVAYKLDQRKLEAQNRLILDQLTFGNESTNPDATKLPVRLAVALLSDRNGVIDINVPIGGSLDDPQFSLGGIILKVIGNAVMKTVTAPFTFIASLFGGSGEDMAALPFEAGRATVPADGEQKLAPLARALTERPGLKLDIAGRYDSAPDTGALRRAALERKLRTLKLRDLQSQAAQDGGVTVSAEERPALLARAYAADKLPMQRNAIGLAKAPPAAEMEQTMLAAIVIEDDDLAALAHRRAQAVKDWLVKHGVADERIFITAAKEGGSKADFTLR